MCRVVEQQRQRLVDGASGLSDRMKRWTFDNFDRLIPGVGPGLEAVLNFAESIREAAGQRGAGPFRVDPRAVTLWGPFGGGKTHLGAALVNFCAGLGLPALYCYCPDLWPYLGATMDQDESANYESRFSAVASVAVLVLDEPGGLVDGLGDANVSQGAAKRRARLVDYRYRAGLPTLYLDNRHPDEWGAPQVADRLVAYDSPCIAHVTPESYRRSRPQPWDRGEN